MTSNTSLSSVSLFFNTSVLTVIIVSVLWFIFYAIGFYRVAKKEEVKNVWLAWIPFVQFYLLGEIVQPKFKYKNTGIILLITQILIVIIPMFIRLNLVTFVIYLIFLLITYIYYQMVFNCFYKIVDPDKAFLYLVLGVLFPFMVPIWVLVLSNPKDNDQDYYGGY